MHCKLQWYAHIYHFEHTIAIVHRVDLHFHASETWTSGKVQKSVHACSNVFTHHLTSK